MFPYDQLSTVPDLSDQIEPTAECIGSGGYGCVYKGRWLGAAANATPAAVAIKIINPVPLSDETQRTKRFKQITRELSLWSSIQHENILLLLGIIRINGDTNIPAFVCPWMENGNAKEFCSRNPHFPPMLILFDIINGLHYLHTFQPEIVHGDIKAVNVLINSSFKACLCDFGLSRLLIDNTLWKTTATQAGGTVRWMAPELLNGDASTPTKESDIYAYAMTCYEILSGGVPFRSVSIDMAIALKVTKGQRPDRMESFRSDSMWDIITRCWEQEPKERIPTEKVLRLLREKKEVEETLATIREKDVALAKVEKEMAVLKEQMAKAEEHLKALKEEKDQVLKDARHDIAEKEHELNSLSASLQQSESAVELLENRVELLERKEEDVEEKYERQVEELKGQLGDTVAMHQTEAAELRQEIERVREGSSLLTEEMMSLRHTNSSLREEVERLNQEAAEARAWKEEPVAVHRKQQNEIAMLHEEVTRTLAGAEKTNGNLENAEVYHSQTKDKPDDVTSQPEETELKKQMKEVEEAPTKIEDTDVKLAEVEEELAALKEQRAEAKISIPEWKPCISSRSEKSLVIGIDVGTTFSGVSYAFLKPGIVPSQILPVTRFIGQGEGRTSPRVPSVVCYDQAGNVIAVGPETDTEINPTLSEIEGVRRAEWFKLRLRPPHLTADKRAQLEKIWSLPEPEEDIVERQQRQAAE